MKTISEDVLTVLSSSTISEDGRSLTLPNTQRDRKLYTKTNEVLESFGGVWTRKVKAHVFKDDVRPGLENAMLTGEFSTARDVGFFETPAHVATNLGAAVGVQRGDRVLEPSAGTGRIVRALAKVGAHVLMIERDDKRREGLIKEFPTFSAFTNTDFLDLLPVGTEADLRVDKVVTNPPFAKVGAGDHLDHVRHAFTFLKRDGLLISILPQSVKYRKDRRYADFYAWAMMECGGEIVDLDDNTFAESGTGVRTCTLRIRK